MFTPTVGEKAIPPMQLHWLGKKRGAIGFA